jgi:hypothetical protein
VVLVDKCTERCCNRLWMDCAGDMANLSLSVADMLRNIVEALEETNAPLKHVYTTLGGEDSQPTAACTVGHVMPVPFVHGSMWQQRECMHEQHIVMHRSAGKYYGMHFGAAKSPFDERDAVSCITARTHAGRAAEVPIQESDRWALPSRKPLRPCTVHSAASHRRQLLLCPGGLPGRAPRQRGQMDVVIASPRRGSGLQYR